MNPKVLVAILVILVLLFVVGVGYGLARGGNEPGLEIPASRDEWMARLGRRVGPEEVRPITLGCLQQNTITLAPGGTCAVEVVPSSWPVRTLALVLEQGSGVTLELKHLGERKQLSPRPVLPEKDCELSVDLPIYKDGAVLRIQCLGGASSANCTLVISGE